MASYFDFDGEVTLKGIIPYSFSIQFMVYYCRKYVLFTANISRAKVALGVVLWLTFFVSLYENKVEFQTN